MIVRDMDSLKGGTLTEDTSIDCLLTAPGRGGTFSGEYDISDGRSLHVSIMDLSDDDIECHLKFLLGTGSSCTIDLAAACPNDRRKKFSVDVVHSGGSAFSRTRMAGINLGSGSLLFYGTSEIPNGSHASDTRQEGRITNLSPGSRSEVSPALLIKDDDVVASHGATLGSYDPNALFYMMSRGLTETEGKRMITIGSLMPVIQSFDDVDLREEAASSLEGLEI